MEENGAAIVLARLLHVVGAAVVAGKLAHDVLAIGALRGADDLLALRLELGHAGAEPAPSAGQGRRRRACGAATWRTGSTRSSCAARARCSLDLQALIGLADLRLELRQRVARLAGALALLHEPLLELQADGVLRRPVWRRRRRLRAGGGSSVDGLFRDWAAALGLSNCSTATSLAPGREPQRAEPRPQRLPRADSRAGAPSRVCSVSGVMVHIARASPESGPFGMQL